MKRVVLGVGTLLLALSMGVSAQPCGACAGRRQDCKCANLGRQAGQGRGRGMAGMRRGDCRGCGPQCPYYRGGQNQNPPVTQAPQTKK